MKYSEEELNIIYENRHDLRRKPDPSTNKAIIEFLRKYDLVSQLPKNTTSQEWIFLKQQALDHIDFSIFQTNYFNEVIKYNQTIDEKLEDPQIQKELELLIKKNSIAENIRQYKNPIYFNSKYQKNSKARKDEKLNEIDIPLVIMVVFSLSIVLSIFIFQN